MNNKCPWCDSENTSQFLKLKDYFLTQEEFAIMECHDCKLLFTSPFPTIDKIGDYYKSENYLSHNEEKKGFFAKIYNKVKRINIKNKFRISVGQKINNSSFSLLDIGCGVGDFLHYAKEKGCNITGIEPNEDARKVAESKLDCRILTPEELKDLPDNSFDIITMWHVLEHVTDLNTEIHHLQRLLKKDGKLVLALPNYKSYDAEYYKEKWAAYDVPRHLYHFSKESIRNIFEKNNFQLIDIKPLKWDSFYISILSEQYLKHKNCFTKGILTGCKSNRKAIKTNEWSSLVYILNKQSES